MSQNVGIDKTSVSMASSSASTLIGFSITVLTLLLTLGAQAENKKALFWALVLIVLCVAFLGIATEFYISAAWQGVTTDTYDDLAFEGTASYGIGLGWLIVAFGLVFLALFSNPYLPYLPPASYGGGLMIFYGVRHFTIKSSKLAGVHDHPRARLAFRIILFTQLLFGMGFIGGIQTGVI